MKRTDIVDIYRLFAVEKFNQNDKIMLRRKKMGIAYVPTIERSTWCKNIMSKIKTDAILVKCIFIDGKGKWEPIEVETERKFPTLLSEINIEIMEVSDSDDE